MTRRLALVTGAAAVLVALGVAPASARPRLTVTPDQDVDPAGQNVTVKGAGYDTSKGVYVAWCVVPPPGKQPTPCGGGEDRSESAGASKWVSSSPPVYGIGLAQPYGPGGSFEVRISVSRMIGEIDCFVKACAVTTRNDHERTDDRSQDVFASVEFRGQTIAPVAPATTSAPPSSVVPRISSSTTAAVQSTTPATVAVTPEPIAAVDLGTLPSAPVATGVIITNDNGEPRKPLALGGVAAALLLVPAAGALRARRR